MSTYPLTLFFDSACPLCRIEMDHLKSRNAQGKLRFVDVSAPGFDPSPYGATMSDMLESIHALKADGSMIHGVEVLRLAYAAAGLGWIAAPAGWPLLRPFFERAYASLARNRYSLSGRFAWVLNGIAARRTLHRMRGCKDGMCEL